MNKRNSLMQYVASFRRKSLVDSEFSDDIVFDIESDVDKLIDAMNKIYMLVRYWSEGMDLINADTLKPTYYLQIFEMLYEDSRNLTYNDISKAVGGANVKKYVHKSNQIAIAKALKMSKENPIYKKILDLYYFGHTSFD